MNGVENRVEDGVSIELEIIPELKPRYFSEKMNDNKQSLD